MTKRAAALPRAIVSSTLCALMAMSACEPQDPTIESFPSRTPVSRPTSSETLVIGLVGSLTGPDSWRGDDAFEGADLGVHELNSSRAKSDTTFELVSLDDEGDPDTALAHLTELAQSDRTVGIVYAGPPEALLEAEGVLAEAGIPALLCYDDLYSARGLSPHVFQVSPSALWEARRIAGYLIRDRRYRRIGALVRPGFEGDVALEALRTALGESGSRLAGVARFSAEGPPLGALRTLERRRVEAVVIDATPGRFVDALRGLRQLHALYRSTDRARIATAPTPRKERQHRAAGDLRSRPWTSPSLRGSIRNCSRRGSWRRTPTLGHALPPGPELHRFRRRLPSVVGERTAWLGASFL